jgi:hypothetical protein
MVKSDHATYRNKIILSFKGRPKKFFVYMHNLQTVKDQVVHLKKQDGSLTKGS